MYAAESPSAMASSMLRMIAAGVVSPDCSSTTPAIGAKQASKGRVSSSNSASPVVIGYLHSAFISGVGPL
jgi:hypothetical protein